MNKFLLKKPLEKKIKKSQDVIREAIKKFGQEKVGIAWTSGKDSTVILHLIKGIFSKIPIKVMFGDTTVHFPAVYKFISKLTKEWDLNLIVAKPEVSYEKISGERERCCHALKTIPARKVIKKQGWKAILVGIRWDEQEARASEKYFSKRNNPKHTRVHPLLHWTEKDIWEYIKKFKVPYNPLYDKGYRSIGCLVCTTPSKKGGTERSGRDKDKEIIMRKLRSLGYW